MIVCCILSSHMIWAQQIKEIDLGELFEGYERSCFILHDMQSGETRVHNPAQSDVRMPPCSTYKIPHTLIALELEIIKDPDAMVKWDGTEHSIKSWNRDHDLNSAMANSVLWYYQRIAEKAGWDAERKYVKTFEYGNQTVDGELTEFWLDKGPLEITPNEQIAFLKRVVTNDLPVTQRSLDILKCAMIFKETEDYILRGKTGSGRLEQGGFGWYVGYLSKGNDIYIFATYIEGPNNAWGFPARNITEKALKKLSLIN